MPIDVYLLGRPAATVPMGPLDKLVAVQSNTVKLVRPADLFNTSIDTEVVRYLSGWLGNALISSVGTITTGIWHGTSITDGYIASAANWNAKQSPLANAATLAKITEAGGLPLWNGGIWPGGGSGGSTGGGGTWGSILGTLANQYDLMAALNGKSPVGHLHTGTYEPANANIQAHVTDTTIHLDSTQKTALTGGVSTALHYHAADRNRANHTGSQSADTITDGSTNKAYTAAEKTKLAAIAAGATANQTDAYLLNRANHTGTQSADTITDGSTNKAYTAAEKTKLAGLASGCAANQTIRYNSSGVQTCAWIVYHAVSAGDETAAQAFDPPPEFIVREDLLSSGPLPSATLTGTPAALTNAPTTDITVGGSSVASYKYTLDGGSQSAELAVSIHIALSGLVAGSHTLSVVGKNSGGTWQTTPTTYTWTIDMTTPTTTASPAAGTYDNSTTVSLSGNETAAIRYTTDSSTPNGSSPIYTSSLVLSSTTTLKYFSQDPAGNAESTKTSVYNINHAPTIAGSPASGTQNVAYSWSPTASDPDGNTLSFTATGTPLPTGLSINSGTGTISGTPTGAGTTSGITITVSDGRLASSITVSIVVAANNQVYDNITVAILTHGTVSPASPIAVPADAGHNQTGSQAVTYAATGYHVSAASITSGSSAIVDDAGLNHNNLVVNVSGVTIASPTLTLTETINQWPLTTTQGSNITISPSAITAVNQTYNSTYTVTPTPSAGYNPYYAVNGGAATLITGDTHAYTILDAAATVAYTAQAIPVPSGLSVTGQSLQNAVSWTVVSGSNVTGYTLQGSDSSGSGYSTLYTGSGTSYTETGLTNAKIRYYQVRANTTRGSHTDSGAYSSYASGTTLALNAPASPSATAGNALNTITWSAPGSGATVVSYNIKWGTTSGSRTNTLTGVTSPYTHSSLTDGTTYYYSVVAVNAGDTAETSEVSAIPSVILPVGTYTAYSGNPPSSVTVVSGGNFDSGASMLRLNTTDWLLAVGDNETGSGYYYIKLYKSTDNAATFTLLGTFTANNAGTANAGLRFPCLALDASGNFLLFYKQTNGTAAIEYRQCAYNADPKTWANWGTGSTVLSSSTIYGEPVVFYDSGTSLYYFSYITTSTWHAHLRSASTIAGLSSATDYDHSELGTAVGNAYGFAKAASTFYFFQTGTTYLESYSSSTISGTFTQGSNILTLSGLPSWITALGGLDTGNIYWDNIGGQWVLAFTAGTEGGSHAGANMFGYYTK